MLRALMENIRCQTIFDFKQRWRYNELQSELNKGGANQR
jgi:hypothetical protein